MTEDRARGDEMRLRVLGAHGSIDVEALHKGLGALLDLLKAGGVTGPLVITDLREGSAEVAVRPRNAAAVVDRRFADIVRGLNDLSEDRIGDDWDAAMLESVVGLATVLDLGGVEGVQIFGTGR